MLEVRKMTDCKLSKEAKSVFEYIKNSLVGEFPNKIITTEYFMLSVMENTDSVAFQILQKTMLSESIDTMKKFYVKYLTENSNASFEGTPLFDKVFDKYIESASETLKGKGELNSGRILLAILKDNEVISKSLRVVGVTTFQVEESLKECEETLNKEATEVKPKPKAAQPKTNNLNGFTIERIIPKPSFDRLPDGEVEKNLTNLNKQANIGKIEQVVECDEVIEKIFTTFAKNNRNNVILVGDSGVGKTAIAKHIANVLVEGKAPKQFTDKQLMKMDFTSLVSGTGFKGMFEAKFKAIVEDAKKKGCYILFIDDIQSVLLDSSKFGEVNLVTMMEDLFVASNVQIIATTNHKSYKSFISSNPMLKRRFEKIVIDEPTDDKCVNILKSHVDRLGKFHGVTYSGESLSMAVKLCRRYMGENKLPESAINVIDECGASIKISIADSENVRKLKDKLNSLIDEKNSELEKETVDFEKVDNITRQQILFRNRISITEKTEKLNPETIEVTAEMVREKVSSKTGIPLTSMTTNDRKELKDIETRIKNVVIGQDEAVDEVCRVIKRKRSGIANPNKPSVLFFGGTTGTGKTYLAKKIAKEVYGDEKYLVRLDMSEYVDKTSVNKITGSSAGYVGYENGGILTEAIKKNKYCVLLLDEIEKANSEVHNMFLQMFDEGRMSDNTGEMVDFRNVIVIMTSNVGAKESSERGEGIGFIKNGNMSEDIIKKELKKKFRPEFLNRIDNIIYFNKLSDENLRSIIELEIHKIEKRVNELGYSFDESITKTVVPNVIMERVKDKKEYGARPIIRELQHVVEDRVSDYLIENEVEKGFVFTSEILGV